MLGFLGTNLSYLLPRKAETSASMDCRSPSSPNPTRQTINRYTSNVIHSKVDFFPSKEIYFRTPVHYRKCSKGLNMAAPSWSSVCLEKPNERNFTTVQSSSGLKMKGYGISNIICRGSHLLDMFALLNGFCNQEEAKSTSLKLIRSKSKDFN